MPEGRCGRSQSWPLPPTSVPSPPSGPGSFNQVVEERQGVVDLSFWVKLDTQDQSVIAFNGFHNAIGGHSGHPKPFSHGADGLDVERVYCAAAFSD